MLRSRWLFACFALPFLVAGCNNQSGPGPEIHDSKYAALGADGVQLAAGGSGPCVLDQFTGLVWEVKTDTPGIHNRENTYSWFDPEEDSSGELDYRGMPGAGKCGAPRRMVAGVAPGARSGLW